jgi:hypothetical protein
MYITHGRTAIKQSFPETCISRTMTPMTERQKYFRLVSESIEMMPASIDDEALLAGLAPSSGIVKNVRLGRSPQLPLLVKIIELALPSFHIAPELRPTTHTQANA